MAVHTSNCNQDDLGAHAKFFDDAPSDGKSPMPSFVLEAEAEEASEVPWRCYDLAELTFHHWQDNRIQMTFVHNQSIGKLIPINSK